MMSYVVLAVALVAMAAAAPAPWYPWAGFPYHHGYPGYGGYGYPGYYGYGHFAPGPYAPGHYGGGKLAYYGDFNKVVHGSCEGAHDGLYYVDRFNFAFCSNGKKSIQACAEGSANPDPSFFHPGSYYGFYDFCAVNLVANGYNGYPGEGSQVYADDDKH